MQLRNILKQIINKLFSLQKKDATNMPAINHAKRKPINKTKKKLTGRSVPAYPMLPDDYNPSEFIPSIFKDTNKFIITSRYGTLYIYDKDNPSLRRRLTIQLLTAIIWRGKCTIRMEKVSLTQLDKIEKFIENMVKNKEIYNAKQNKG